MADEELSSALRKVSEAFNVDEILSESIDQEHIIDYYTQSNHGYSVFHSANGSVHMAVNPDGVFDKRGYYAQAEMVGDLIEANNATQVLELASGKGFNATYLASRYPEVQFTGIDITPAYLRAAQKRAVNVANAEFVQGDFQRLRFPDRSFDIVFVVESLCHADDMLQALSEAYRVLRPGGVFLVVDGFRTAGYLNRDPELQMACRLVEVSMAVGTGQVLDDWLATARDVGFQVERKEDLSQAIMPNLERFRHLAKGFLKYRTLTRTFQRVLPRYLVRNAIAGLLMPETLERGAHSYYAVTLRKLVA